MFTFCLVGAFCGAYFLLKYTPISLSLMWSTSLRYSPALAHKRFRMNSNRVSCLIGQQSASFNQYIDFSEVALDMKFNMRSIRHVGIDENRLPGTYHRWASTWHAYYVKCRHFCDLGGSCTAPEFWRIVDWREAEPKISIDAYPWRRDEIVPIAIIGFTAMNVIRKCQRLIFRFVSFLLFISLGY